MALQTLVRAKVHPASALRKLVEGRLEVQKLPWVLRSLQHALGAAKDAAPTCRAGALAGLARGEYAAAAVSLLATATPRWHDCSVSRAQLLARRDRSWTHASSCLDFSARLRGRCNRGLREDGSRGGVFNTKSNNGRPLRGSRVGPVELVVASHDLSRALRREFLHSSSGLLIDGFVQPTKFHQGRSQQFPKARILAHGVQSRRRAPHAVSAVLALGRRARLPWIEAASRSGASSLSQASATARAHDARKEIKANRNVLA